MARLGDERHQGSPRRFLSSGRSTFSTHFTQSAGYRNTKEAERLAMKPEPVQSMWCLNLPHMNEVIGLRAKADYTARDLMSNECASVYLLTFSEFMQGNQQ